MGTNKINLGKISDKQQLLLTQLSYLDFDMEEYEKMKLSEKTITISDLEGLLSNPGDSYLGLTYMKTKEFELMGLKIPTQREIIQRLRDNGLGDLQIVDIAGDPEINFKAIAFDDNFGNRGFSYSGTDFTKISQDIDDNLPIYIKESPELIKAAKKFFNKTKGENNYLYEHAGNMAMHTYIDNYNDVNRIFTINSTNIEREYKKVDSPEMQIAISDIEKNLCYRTGGAYVGEFEGELDPYEFNVRYIPSQRTSNSLLMNLIPDCIMFIENMDLVEYEENIYNINNNFIEISKEQANNVCKPVPKRKRIIENQEENKKSLKLKQIINKIGKFSKDIAEKSKIFIKNIFGKKEDLLTDGTNDEKEDAVRKFKEGYEVTDNNSGQKEDNITNEEQKMTDNTDKVSTKSNTKGENEER